MRIAIVDDDTGFIKKVETVIEDYCRKAGEAAAVRLFSDGGILLEEPGQERGYDAYILDVEMPRLDGLELARRIRETDARVALAFLTNHPGYVFAGYEVAALRYLMKPVAEDNLFPLLDLVLSRLGRASRYLAVEADGEHLRLEEDAILYLEARGHAVRIETEGGPVTVKEPLSALACRLGTDFVPAHRSFLVNLRRVERVGRTACLLEGGRSVPVSRGAWERLSRAFIDYYREA